MRPRSRSPSGAAATTQGKLLDYTGMRLIGTRYALDRELTQDERADQLRQDRRLEIAPAYELSVVKVNSTFLESVDRYYARRGYLFFMMVVLSAGLSLFYLLFSASCIGDLLDPSKVDVRAENYGSLAFINAICLPPLAFLIYAALQESFTYTYFPIRLNRKNKKVYVFRPGRPNKSVLEADWDKIFFTLGACNVGLVPGQNWDIRGHILDADRKIVLDTFSFSTYSMSKDSLRRHWEFLRRYMEDGPREAFEEVEVCMPLADRRESFVFAFQRIRVNFKGVGGLWIALLPIWLASIVARWAAGLTCRVPRWPTEIEAACRLEMSDPYARDASVNPVDL